ncbi:MAG TPA: sigma-70 family RNA polymerase sigma factor [Actinomycetes bacterium]|nr:sigma-70 family RNA polymerase sigma factor [Actinomycetes bacterium]
MTPTDQTEDAAILAAVRAGDQAAFAALAERYRRQLHVHCYRMLGSFEDAEDLVQETLLRAWRSRSSFQGRSLFRTWLYRIATNACLTALQRGPRRVLVADVPPRDPGVDLPLEERPDVGAPPAELPWLQPYPDHLLDQAAPSDAEPDAVVVSRETIELAYLAAIQHLPPRQRAILILRDALGWSAKDTAGLLETSVASVNSALQRARSTMRARLPARRLDWTQATGPTDDERSVLRRFMDAHDRADVAAFAALLREDARQAMPPHPLWYDGREAMVTLFDRYIHPTSPNYPGRLRCVPTAANRQPAVAVYVRREGDDRYRVLGLNVLEIENGLVSAITSFGVQLLGAFGLPQTLPADR